MDQTDCLLQKRPVIQGCCCCCLSNGIDVKRLPDPVEHLRQHSRHDAVAHPQTGKTVCLGKGTQGHQRAVNISGRPCFQAIPIPGKLDIGLVHDHHHIIGQPGHETVEILLGDNRAGGVVGVADKYQTGVGTT
jgi:hypothetical protein